MLCHAKVPVSRMAAETATAATAEMTFRFRVVAVIFLILSLEFHIMYKGGKVPPIHREEFQCSAGFFGGLLKMRPST